MATTYVKCSKCGRVAEVYSAMQSGWLIATRKGGGGKMIIRCPNCITKYALGQVKK